MDTEGIVSIPRVDFVLHSQGGWTERVGNEDETGTAIDISAKAYRLRTESGLDVAFVADPDNALGLKVSLTEAQVGAIQDLDDHSTRYAIVDTTAAPDEVLSFGRLIVEGW